MVEQAQLWDLFRSLGKDALVMNHYDLAMECEGTTPEDWKIFLTDTAVIDWVQSEIALLQESELKKLAHDVSKSRSVGQAQLMNVMKKMNEDKVERDGPAFVYMCVPLNTNEQKADNVQQLDKDVFIDET